MIYVFFCFAISIQGAKKGQIFLAFSGHWQNHPKRSAQKPLFYAVLDSYKFIEIRSL